MICNTQSTEDTKQPTIIKCKSSGEATQQQTEQAIDCAVDLAAKIASSLDKLQSINVKSTDKTAAIMSHFDCWLNLMTIIEAHTKSFGCSSCFLGNLLHARDDLKKRLVSLIEMLSDTLIEDGKNLLDGARAISQTQISEIENRQGSLETLFRFLGTANQDEGTRNRVKICQNITANLKKKSTEMLVLNEL